MYIRSQDGNKLTQFKGVAFTHIFREEKVKSILSNMKLENEKIEIGVQTGMIGMPKYYDLEKEYKEMKESKDFNKYYLLNEEDDVIAEYETKERAKEVFNEIIEHVREGKVIYELPKE